MAKVHMAMGAKGGIGKSFIAALMAQYLIALRWQADAARSANKILNAALDAGRSEMAKGMTAGAAQVVRIVNEATDAALAKQRAEGNRLLREMKATSYLTLAGSFVLMAGALIMTYMVTR